MGNRNTDIDEAINSAEIIESDETKELPKDEIREFQKAREHSQAQLYTSLSRLLKWSAYIFFCFVLLLIFSWAILQYFLTFNNYDDLQSQKIQNLILKIEGLSSYLLTMLLGYAGGISKLFLNNKE